MIDREESAISNSEASAQEHASVEIVNAPQTQHFPYIDAPSQSEEANKLVINYEPPLSNAGR